jgi:hypothetical protein
MNRSEREDAESLDAKDARRIRIILHTYVSEYRTTAKGKWSPQSFRTEALGNGDQHKRPDQQPDQQLDQQPDQQPDQQLDQQLDQQPDQQPKGQAGGNLANLRVLPVKEVTAFSAKYRATKRARHDLSIETCGPHHVCIPANPLYDDESTNDFKYRRLQVVHALEPKSRSERLSSAEKERLPLLPPDCVEGNHDLGNKGYLVSHSNASEARSMYQYLSSMNSSNRKHRMFVHGVFYRNIFPGVHVVDGRGSTILDVDCQDGTQTTVKITMCCNYTVLNAATKLGGSWGAGNANRLGDRGQMCVAGLRNAKTGQEYVIKKDHEDLVLEASKAAADWAEAHYPEVVKSIQEAESTKGGREIAYMDSRMGRTTVQSIDLCNADHFDVNDSSLSLSIFTEVIPGDATNWRFVMPNLSFDGSKGVVVDLVHGTAISWDGTKVRHCTAEPTTHPNNHVYGLFYGSCR